MIADQNFYDICFEFFYPTASAMAYRQSPKFVGTKHSATAKGENCAYGPILIISFGYVDSQAKIFLSLNPPFENTTTWLP